MLAVVSVAAAHCSHGAVAVLHSGGTARESSLSLARNFISRLPRLLHVTPSVLGVKLAGFYF